MAGRTPRPGRRRPPAGAAGQPARAARLPTGATAVSGPAGGLVPAATCCRVPGAPRGSPYWFGPAHGPRSTRRTRTGPCARRTRLPPCSQGRPEGRSGLLRAQCAAVIGAAPSALDHPGAGPSYRPVSVRTCSCLRAGATCASGRPDACWWGHMLENENESRMPSVLSLPSGPYGRHVFKRAANTLGGRACSRARRSRGCRARERSPTAAPRLPRATHEEQLLGNGARSALTMPVSTSWVRVQQPPIAGAAGSRSSGSVRTSASRMSGPIARLRRLVRFFLAKTAGGHLSPGSGDPPTDAVIPAAPQGQIKRGRTAAPPSKPPSRRHGNDEGAELIRALGPRTRTPSERFNVR